MLNTKYVEPIGFSDSFASRQLHEPKKLIKKVSGINKKAKVPAIPFHNLRHTHATILMRMGENPKVVSERLGHARVGITLDIYSHTRKKCRRKQPSAWILILDTMDKNEQKRINGSLAAPSPISSLVQRLCSHCAMYKNTGQKWKTQETNKKLKPLIHKDLSLV